MFVSFEEDFHFMREIYRVTYEGRRIIFRDNTDASKYLSQAVPIYREQRGVRITLQMS